MPDLSYENKLLEAGIRYIAGVDEAGRGCLAGPVVAAAVVLEPGLAIPGVDDSKRLRPNTRDALYSRIISVAAGVGVGVASPREVDELNIWGATCLAARRALGRLPFPIQHVLMDGLYRIIDVDIPQIAISGGDRKSVSIAAASIVAKVRRDRILRISDRWFPGYGFFEHKGYATEKHKRALNQLGPSPIHRRSFAPIRQLELW